MSFEALSLSLPVIFIGVGMGSDEDKASLCPVVGYHKVSAAQKLKLYRTGYDTVAKAVRNYKRKKRRIRKEFWMNGNTFFIGGFLDYLPAVV